MPAFADLPIDAKTLHSRKQYRCLAKVFLRKNEHFFPKAGYFLFRICFGSEVEIIIYFFMSYSTNVDCLVIVCFYTCVAANDVIISQVHKKNQPPTQQTQLYREARSKPDDCVGVYTHIDTVQVMGSVQTRLAATVQDSVTVNLPKKCFPSISSHLFLYKSF